MAQLILGFVVFGILAFLINTLNGGEFKKGVARVDNNTEVVASPLFTGKSVAANLEIINKNNFDISNLTLKCTVHGRSGTRLKTISKKINQTVAANASIKVDNFPLTVVRDWPKTIECRIAAFSGGNNSLGGVEQDTKKDFRKIEIK